MYSMIYTSKSGMYANQNKLDIISNNIANSNTIGYKSLNNEFSDLLVNNLYSSSRPVNSKDAIAQVGAKINKSIASQTQGALKQTNVAKDLAINGKGYFRLISDNGNYLYTRNGEFNIDSTGKITDKNGNILEINFTDNYNYNNSNLNSESVVIDKSGNIYSDNINIGKIPIYEAIGSITTTYIDNGNYYLLPDESVSEVNDTEILSGYLEASNVDMSKEISDMLITQRSFQLNSKSMQTVDYMWSIANNISSR